MRKSSEQNASSYEDKPVRPFISKNFTSLPLQPVSAEGPPEHMDGALDPEGSHGDPDGTADADNHEEFRTRVKPGPVEPSAMDKDHHECTGHSVFRSWCAACVEGRGRAQPHQSHDHSDDSIPVLSFDYGFLGGEVTRYRGQ